MTIPLYDLGKQVIFAVAIFNLFSENFHDKTGLVSFPSVDPQGPRLFAFHLLGQKRRSRSCTPFL